ncbi:hypothetical protein SAMN05518871_11040 [Psychrobacillus sp. OK028]|nr:hypothetical protein SAMN05518871_11040 [Psychrobacillus sp. OK028]
MILYDSRILLEDRIHKALYKSIHIQVMLVISAKYENYPFVPVPCHD